MKVVLKSTEVQVDPSLSDHADFQREIWRAIQKKKKKYVLTHSISVFKSLCNILKLKVISVFSCSLIACTAKKLLSDLHKNYDTFFSGSLSCNPTLDLSLD